MTPIKFTDEEIKAFAEAEEGYDFEAGVRDFEHPEYKALREAEPGKPYTYNGKTYFKHATRDEFQEAVARSITKYNKALKILANTPDPDFVAFRKRVQEDLEKRK
jgi:hypothetical protein